jgi:hypothetical protein
MGAFKARVFSKNPAIYQKSGLNLQNNLIQMPQRNFFCIVVSIFLFYGEILGQEKNVEKNTRPIDKSPDFSIARSFKYSNGNVKNTRLMTFSGEIKALPEVFRFLSSSFKLYNPVAKDFYTSQLSFFCRQELLIEKATSIPLRFRLGSLQYTDYLEGKGLGVRSQ